jgi:hypothetical protein
MHPVTTSAMGKSRKKQVNIRLGEVGLDLLYRIAEEYDISMGAVIEMLLRAEAIRLGLPTTSRVSESPVPGPRGPEKKPS